MSSVEVLSRANPEWIAKTQIVILLNKASAAMGLAATDAHFMREFKAYVVALYGLVRYKMHRYSVKLGLKKEKLERYDTLLKDRKALKAAKYGEVVDWFFDVQKALEILGYTRFERTIDVEQAIIADRGG